MNVLSWEEKPIELVLGLTHQGNVSMEWAQKYAELYAHLSATRKFYLSYSRGAPLDIARNHAVDDMLRLGATWLFFLDSDVLVPHNIIDRLLTRNLPIVSALYYRRHKPVHAGMWRIVPQTQTCTHCGQPFKPRKKGKYNPIVEYERGTLINSDVIGMGAVLIHRKVIEKTHHPPEDPLFVWSAGREAYLKEHILQNVIDDIGTSEDFYACEKIKKAGFHIIVDTSIVCPHVGEARFIPPELMNVDEIKYGGIGFPNI